MEKTAFIVAHWNKYNKSFDYALQGYRPSENSDHVVVHEIPVPFETINEKELQGRIVIALRAKKTQIFEDAAQEAKEVDDEIQELLAIEDKSGEPQSSALPGGDDDIPF
jgi:hypothetical protein